MNPPVDTALLLRVHAEHRWLQDELSSVLDELDQAVTVRASEMVAAFSYLEVAWTEELRRARQTDAAYHRLECQAGQEQSALTRQARGYYTWLRRLRRTLAARAEPYVGAGAMASELS